jgi:hypothetical protein
MTIVDPSFTPVQAREGAWRAQVQKNGWRRARPAIWVPSLGSEWNFM